jgi:hypothetical protein
MKSLIIAGLVCGSFITIHSNPSLLEWIPPECCVTKDCCWEIAANEIIPITETQYEVVATGQKVESQISKDGKYYRCACESQGGGNWLRHIKAHTHCIFVPEVRLNM